MQSAQAMAAIRNVSVTEVLVTHGLESVNVLRTGKVPHVNTVTVYDEPLVNMICYRKVKINCIYVGMFV